MNQSKTVPILLTIIAVSFVSILILLYQNINSNKSVSIQTIDNPSPSIVSIPTVIPTSTITPTKSATSSAVDTKNWKNYTNNTHNFSLRYPASWSINTNEAELKENAKLVLSSRAYKIIVWSNLVGIGGGTKVVPSENITISGIELYKRDLGENVVEKSGSFEIASRPDSPTFAYLNKTYDISFEYPFIDKGNQSYKNNLEIFDQILSTFKFTQ